MPIYGIKVELSNRTCRSIDSSINYPTDYSADNPTDYHHELQWNLDLTKSLGTGQICSLNRGFVISKTSI